MLTEMWEKIVNKKSGSQGGADGVVGGAEQFYQEYSVCIFMLVTILRHVD